MPKSCGFLSVLMIACMQTSLVSCDGIGLDGTPGNVIEYRELYFVGTKSPHQVKLHSKGVVILQELK